MSTVDYRFIDADQHTYEPGDCFSRHMEAKFRNRTVELGAADPDGHRPFVLGRTAYPAEFRRQHHGPGHLAGNPLPRGKAGDSGPTKRRSSPPQNIPNTATAMPRLAWMDAHNVEACILNCTLPPDLLWGSGDMELHYAHLRSFNRHLEGRLGL